MELWLESLHEAKARLAAPVDPWGLRLERVRGQIGDDGIERISTQTLFDHLEVFQRSRGAGACRRLAQVMRELGWHACKSARSDARWVQGASSRLLPRLSVLSAIKISLDVGVVEPPH